MGHGTAALFGAHTAPSSITSPVLRSAFATLRDDRPDLRVLSWMFGADDALLPWLQSVAVTHEPDLARYVPPLPPEHLRRIVAAPETEIFLWTGFADLVGILSLFGEHHRRPTAEGWDVLDFGCGCGRLSRFFVDAPVPWRAYGTELNAAHVEWCTEALPAVDTRLNLPGPPLPFDSASMDLLYSVSVFSHLPAEGAAAWLADLARVLRPGGILALTTHGDNVLGTIERSEQHQQMFRLSAAEVPAVAERLRLEGIVHLAYDADVLEMAQAGDAYGNTFVSRTFVETNWQGPDFELCAFHPAGLRGWHDLVALRRR